MPRKGYMIEIDWLVAFAAIAHTGTFTHAAEQLHIAQPALSRKMRKLEDFLGCQLIIRNAAPVTRLTPAGESLLRDSFEILARVENLTALKYR